MTNKILSSKNVNARRIIEERIENLAKTLAAAIDLIEKYHLIVFPYLDQDSIDKANEMVTLFKQIHRENSGTKIG